MGAAHTTGLSGTAFLNPIARASALFTISPPCGSVRPISPAEDPAWTDPPGGRRGRGVPRPPLKEEIMQIRALARGACTLLAVTTAAWMAAPASAQLDDVQLTSGPRRCPTY